VSACRAFQPDHGELHQSQIAELANELVNGRQLSQDAIRILLGRVFGWTQSPLGQQDVAVLSLRTS
jgi:hypothetical protein